MAINQGTLVLVAVDRVPKTPIEKFTPGIVASGTNNFGHCGVRFGSAFSPDFPYVAIGMWESDLVPLLRLPEEEWGLEPQEALQRHWEEAVRNLATIYIRFNTSLTHFVTCTLGES